VISFGALLFALQAYLGSTYFMGIVKRRYSLGNIQLGSSSTLILSFASNSSFQHWLELCVPFFTLNKSGLKAFPSSEDVNNPSQVTWTDKIVIGALNSGTMLASNYALQFLGFPLQVLFKSCKAVPIMVVGLFRKSVKYERRQYFWAILITVGLLCFQFNSFFGSKTSTGNWFGIGLLVVSLICDGFLGTQEDKLTKHKNASSFELMQASGIVGAVITSLIITIDGEWAHIFAFLQLREFWKDFILITVAGVIGQVFVYWTLFVHNSLVLSIVTTLRKLCAVFLSIYMFNHEIHISQIIGIAIVFSGTFIDTYFTKFKGGKHKGH